jgi:hypothetical protein
VTQPAMPSNGAPVDEGERLEHLPARWSLQCVAAQDDRHRRVPLGDDLRQGHGRQRLIEHAAETDERGPVREHRVGALAQIGRHDLVAQAQHHPADVEPAGVLRVPHGFELGAAVDERIELALVDVVVELGGEDELVEGGAVGQHRVRLVGDVA